MIDWLDHSFATVVALSWRASVLILAFVGLRWLGRRWIPPRVIFAGWVLIAVRLLVPFSFPSDWSPYQIVRPFGDAVNATVAATPAPPAARAPLPATSMASQPLDPPRPAASWSRPRLLGVFWLAGVAAMLSARGVTSHLFERNLRRSRREDDPRLRVLIAQEARELGIRAQIQIATSAALHAPAIMGLWRPRLLMPAGFPAQLSDAELRFVLRHELGHWRRRDLWSNAVLHAALAVHWFNPFAWLAVRLARRDCEFACDEFVLRTTSHRDAGAYGATLLKALGAVSRLHPSPPALGVFENKQQLKRRIQMIISNKSANLRRTLAGAALIGLVVLGSFTQEIAAEEANVENITTEAPKPWFKNGSETKSYVVGVDPVQKHLQPYSAYVKSTAPAVEGFGGMMQAFSAEHYVGKRVRFSAWMKTQEVPLGANLWMRIDGTTQQILEFDNMSDRPIKGTSEWTHCAIVLDVPADSAAISFGFFISGTGQAWVNDAKFETVGPAVATTRRGVDRTPSLKAPQNLAFNPTAAE